MKKEELRGLWMALDNVMKFVDNLEKHSLPFFYHFLEYMQENIDTYLCYCKADAEWEEKMDLLENVLYRDWKGANHTEIGIPAFDIWLGDVENKVEVCIQFLNLISAVDCYFISENSCCHI